MTKISTYAIDTDVTGSDKWIGTDSQNFNLTKNFTPVKLAKYFNTSEIISTGANLRYVYDILEVGEQRKYGTITFDPQQGASVPFSTITTFILSKFTTGGKDVEQYITKLPGSQIIICNADNPNSFGVFDIVSVTQIVAEPNFYTVTLDFVDGYGNLVEDKSYAFQLIRFSQDAPDGVQSVTGNIVNNTDPENPIVTQVQSDWNASSGLGQILNKPAIPAAQVNSDWNANSGVAEILNKPTIPTKTSDLVNDGEDGISPFISQVAVQDFPDRDSFPTIGQNGVIYIAEDTDLAYTWDSNTMDYVLTTMPDTGITGIGKTNRVAKFTSPTNIIWSKISEDQFGGVKIADSNRPFLTGNSVLSIQRSQNQLDFVMGNSNINQPVEIISDNTGGGLEIKSKGILSLKAGASYLEGIKVLTDGKLQITQAPDAGATSDLVLVRDSSGNVKTISYPSLTGFVPYTGATQDVDLGEYELKAGQIEFDQSPTGTASVAVTRWNNTMGVSETTLKGGNVILKNGVDLVARVVNKVTPNTTLTKAAYQVVRISGAQGQRLAIQLAQANNDNNSADTLGVVIETIPTNQEGFIMTVGQLEDINTTGSLQGETWVDGDVLYLSPTIPGAITKVKPDGSTGHIVVIGYVEYAHANHGKIYVKVMNGWELDELHNVYINSPTNNQVLAYTSSTQLWENKTLIQDSITDGVTTIAPSQNAVFDALATKQDTLTNPITGTGASGRVAFFNGATTQAGGNGLFWDNTNKRLGIGTTSPQSSLNVFGTNELLRFGDGSSGNDAFMSFNDRGFLGFRGTGGLNFIVNTLRPIIFGIGNTFSSFTESARFSAVNGNFLINTATDSGFRLDVNGTTRLNGNTSIGGGTAGARLDVRAQGALSTDIAFRVRNSADTANLISVDGIGQTIITPSALTGSAATNALDIAQTWNTTGTPTLIRANVTDTASNANSLLMDLRVGNASRLSVTKSGAIFFGVGSNFSNIVPVGSTQTDSRLQIIAGQGGNVGSISLILLTSNNNITSTSGSPVLVGIARDFIPTSGTANYTLASITSTINQTGGANGITRGLFIQPTLTSAADWRSIEWTNNTGRGLWGSGTANNAMAGSLNVGAATNANASAILEATSTTQGFLPPRMTTTQRNAIASPATGLIVYDTTLNKLCVRTASAWETITSI